MIRFTIKIVLVLFTNLIVLTKNPVKMRIILLIIRILIFYTISFQSGIVWFPILFSLLFMGGILMMFIILSSVLPNEKRTKINMLPIAMTFMLIFNINREKILDSRIRLKITKRFLRSNFRFYFLVLILILYFFSTITMLCKVEMPIRSVSCCEKS